MRRLVVLASLLAFALGCGDSSGPSSSAHILYRLDAQSCAGIGSLTLNLFVDGVQRGTQSFAPGGSATVDVEVGQHAVSATVANSSIAFTPQTYTLAAGQTATYLMICS
jgi:hypothetical protein